MEENKEKIKVINWNWIALAIVYFSLLFYIFFLARRRISIHHSGKRFLHLVPFKDKIEFYTATYKISNGYRWSFYTDLLGNILLFIPFAILLVFAFNVKNLKKVFLISLITSILIETIQYIFRIGIADIDDVILNSTGALLGICFIKLIQKFNLPFIDKAMYTSNC